MVVNQSQFHFMNRLNKNYVIWSCYTQNKQSFSIKWINVEASLIVLLQWLWISVYSHWVQISGIKHYLVTMGCNLRHLKARILFLIVWYKITGLLLNEWCYPILLWYLIFDFRRIDLNIFVYSCMTIYADTKVFSADNQISFIVRNHEYHAYDNSN